MKKIILVALWIVPCLASLQQGEIEVVQEQEVSVVPQDGMETLKAEQVSKQCGQAQQEAQKLPNEVVDSLIEHSPKQVKNFVYYLKQLSSQKDEDLPRRLFLHGPAGVGKTDTAIALALKAGVPYTLINASSCGNKFQNSAKKKLERLFKPFIDSEEQHVVIIDEVTRLIENYNESKGSHEDNITATHFWNLIDKCIENKKIAVIATANSIERCPEMVQSRFEEFVELKHPDISVKKKLLQLYMPKGFTCADKELDQLSAELGGFSPRIIQNILRLVKGGLAAQMSNKTDLKYEDFKEVIHSQRALCKTEGTIDKIVKNAQNEFVEKPISTTTSVTSAVSSVVSVYLQYKSLFKGVV